MRLPVQGEIGGEAKKLDKALEQLSKSVFRFHHKFDKNTVYTCTPIVKTVEVTWQEDGKEQSAMYGTEDVRGALSAGTWIPVQEEGD